MLRELARAFDPERPPGAPAAPADLAALRRDLEALCRKVHVARRVDARYTGNWRRVRDAEPLPAAGWPLLVAVLLADAAGPPGAGDEARGLALKSLNAALATLDLAPEPLPDALGAELRRLAQEALDALTAPGALHEPGGRGGAGA